jgi:1-acyl-sn-glycerol-3-phosphate acyltransferase
VAEPVYRPVIGVALGLFRALDLKLDVRGQENIPATGGAVILINHISYLDFALAGVPFWRERKRMVRFMAKKSTFESKVTGPLMRGMHHIPVDRSAGAGSFRAAVEALRAGEFVGVFPEATIHPHYCLAPFKTGAARMASEAGVPVIPLVLWGSQRVMTKGQPRNLRKARHTPISLTVGAPISPAELADPAAGTALLFDVTAKLLDDAQRRYPPPKPGEPDWWQPAHLGGSAPPRPPDATTPDVPAPNTTATATTATGTTGLDATELGATEAEVATTGVMETDVTETDVVTTDATASDVATNSTAATDLTTARPDEPAPISLPLPSQTPPERASTQQESAQRETAQRETAQPESIPQETAQQETAQPESIPQETAQQETAQPESIPQETAQQETAQQESIPQGTAHQEPAQRGTAESAAEQDAARPQPPRRTPPRHASADVDGTTVDGVAAAPSGLTAPPPA